MIDGSHDPELRSWVAAGNTGDFPIQNLPLGVFRRRGSIDEPAIGAAIGDQILDLRAAGKLGLLDELSSVLRDAVAAPALNRLMALDPAEWSRLRRHLQGILDVRGHRAEPASLVPRDGAELLLPAVIGDYTDFYASVYHATRVGELFRSQDPLPRNYKYLPIAYHGRSSSIVPSGWTVRRPAGQIKGTEGTPMVGPSERLDYESEIGFFVGPGNALGESLTIDQAEASIFGFCILCDWSARDLQTWESQPLGPFLAKNFATTISPWVVMRDALEPFRCPARSRPAGDPAPLPYLSSSANEAAGGIDITVEVQLRSREMRRASLPPVHLSKTSFRDMYWTPSQMVTHHASNGCNLRSGDLLASGTISGPDRGSEGCLLEMTRGGVDPIVLPTGERRGFLADGDEVIMRAYCERAGFARIGFGECLGIVNGAGSR
jgi:fumarylacetoacetase